MHSTELVLVHCCIVPSTQDLRSLMLLENFPSAYPDQMKLLSKKMLRVIKFVLDTRTFGLRLQPVKCDEWFVKAYSDSDWAGDKDSRKSVSGFFIFVNGALVGWRSKSQHCISLSSSEAEMYALTEAIKEIPFIIQLLLFIGVKVQLPVQVKVDNMGAIYMSENSTPSARTQHADIRQKFTADLQDKGLIKVDFVRSEDNTSDILTKNVTVELFNHHTKHIIAEKAEVEGKVDKSPVRKGVGRVTGSLSPSDPSHPNKGKAAYGSTEPMGLSPMKKEKIPPTKSVPMKKEKIHPTRSSHAEKIHLEASLNQEHLEPSPDREIG